MSTLSGLGTLPQVKIQDQIGVALMAKFKDQAEQQGQDLVKMMQQSAQPHLGKNLNVLA